MANFIAMTTVKPEKWVFYFFNIIVLFDQQVSGTLESCIGTCYSGRILPEPADIFHGKLIQGFSYKNITTDDSKKCYSSCIQDCRCKACQMKDARCELLDEDKTSKADNFTSASGYVYYDLKQIMYQGKSHMVPPGVCYNGCCRSNPCLNGGTCTEHCQSPKEKFTCLCTKNFTGKVCEKLVYYSCMDVINKSPSEPKDGVYVITRTNKETVKFPVFCDFEGPNLVWTLIESFSLDKRSDFIYQPFYVKHIVNMVHPNWEYYRMGIDEMTYLKSKSTLFRATCDFPKRSGSLTPDQLIGDLSDADIINERDVHGCKKYKLVNIRGHQCTNCTALTAHGIMGNCHFHLDVTWGVCDFRPPYVTQNVDSFGFYEKIDSVSKCTATPQSTTQWWLGQER